ncbi:MAG: Fe-S cluster assembly protein SufD [Thermoanaerobaculia bacterium]|nr:Fe-S cluster assembly protein SufD [Thermoanaerobaculia bacterium]
MQAIAEKPSLLTGYAAFEAALPAAPAWLGALRRRGLELFEQVGFPSQRLEAWRSTNVAPIARTDFHRPAGELHALTREKLQPFFMDDCVELVFVNGGFRTELSRLDGLPATVVASSLARALAERPEQVEPYLGRRADLGRHPFAALNTAHLADGAFIHVPRGVIVERPIHLLFVATVGEQPMVSYPRNLIVAGEHSQVTVIENFAGFTGDRYFTCAVTEIFAGPSAVVDHYKLEQESIDAFHVALEEIYLERSANFFSHSISHGGALVRNDVHALLDAEGIECTLNGLYLTRGRQHVDNHMLVDHAKPHCHSYELYKGVLEGRSKAVFNGKIVVHQDAQKTDAKQSNRNLLLSDESLVQSNPQLEIFADDVRCTHGSTTGHLDDDAVFYLRSRGIGEEAAKSLLTYAFAAEVLSEIRLDRVRRDLEEFLFTRLPKGEVVRQAV